MTEPEFVEHVLREQWHDRIEGRENDVGELDRDIKVVFESDPDWSQMSLETYDYICITDGGVIDIEAASVGWHEEDRTSRVDLDIRTKDGRKKLYGERDEENNAPRWGGLMGEAERCLKVIRGREKEFDIVAVDEANDLSGEMGGLVWRGVVSVRLEQRNINIDATVDPEANP